MGTERISPGNDIIGSSVDPGTTTRVDDTIISSTLAATSSNVRNFALNNKNYNVVRQIASSGEAEVFLVEEGGKQQVLKYYFSNYKPKGEIITKLQSIRRADIIVPLHFGYHHDRFWEINEYMEGGTLNDILPVRDLTQFKALVAKIAETIHACHSHNIIHRDIKPVNIFFRQENRQEIVLGDFGIASPIQDGQNYRVTTVARTSTYAAPELFTNINNLTTLDNKVDWYALGITLLEMWIGDDPFKGVMQFNIMRIKTEGRVAIPPDIHPDIETIIKGLITTEPPKRWGYEEIQKWLRGEPVKVYYHTENITYAPYDFDAVQGIKVNNPRELAYQMERNPKKAAKQLYSHSISEWIKSASQDLYSEVFDIVEHAYPNTSEANVEAGITKTIYLLDKERAFRSYDGSEWQTPQDLGTHIEAHQAHYKQDLANPAAKLYLFLEARGFQERADKYRRYYQNFPADKAFNLVVLDLQDNKLIIDGHLIENINQLSSVSDVTLMSKIINQVADVNSKVSIWLDTNYSHLADNINRWRYLKEYHIVTLRYALRTGGLRIGGQELMSVDEFYGLIRENPALITNDEKAAENRSEASYWLKNYQQTSLLNVVTEYQFLREAKPEPEAFLPLFQYLLKEDESVSPFEVTDSLAGEIKAVYPDDPRVLKSIAEAGVPAYHEYMDEQRQLKTYATESLYDIVKAIRAFYIDHPTLSVAVLHAINDRFSQYVHEDLRKLDNHSEYFDLLRENLKNFLHNSVVPLSSSLPYYDHWKKEQELIEKRTAVLTTQLEKEKLEQDGMIERKFAEYMNAHLENQVNYLDKGKRFYIIFVKTATWLFLLPFLAMFAFAPDGILGGIVTAVIIFVISRVLIRHVRYRKPNAGLGAIFDPLHKRIGKLLYRPIMKRMLADGKNPLSDHVKQMKATELQKSADIFKGKTLNTLFEERVRIVLLPHEELEKELAKN